MGAVDSGAECGGGESRAFRSARGTGGGHDESATWSGLADEVTVESLCFDWVGRKGEEGWGGALKTLAQHRIK